MQYFIQSAYWLLILVSVAGLSHLRQPITDILSNFYLHYVFVGSLLFILGLHWRLPRTALVSASIAAICFGLTFNYDRVSIEEFDREKAKEPVYNIMTFNAWELAKTMDRLKDYLKTEKPDFVILQEITLKDWRSLKELKSIYPYMSYCDDWLCGVALLSRHKWTEVKAGNFGPHKLPLITAKFDEKFKDLKLFATHTARPHWKYSTQREQFEHLATHISKTTTSPTILGGDLNSTVFSALLRDFGANSSLKAAGKITVTWPQRFRQLWYLRLPILQLGIDHFFVKPDMKILRKWRGPDLGSDHRPLLMDFRL